MALLLFAVSQAMILVVLPLIGRWFTGDSWWNCFWLGVFVELVFWAAISVAVLVSSEK